MTDLAAYLAAAAGRPWAWGSDDCTTYAGDWVLACTGVDPIAQWRGYSTEDEVERLIAEAGGLENLWDEGMAAVWPRAAIPSAGAVGIVTLPGQDGTPIDVGGIWTGRRWSIRSPRGIASLSV
jgi:hypothetical protein